MPEARVTDPWLNYHHVYYFRVIAEEGSISGAARRLRVGQPTLSTQLKQLEARLGTRLFDRQHRRLTLTEAGKVALEYAQGIFKIGDEMVQALQGRLVQDRVHVRIGALDALPKHLVLSLAEAAYRIRGCTVSVVEGRGDELLRELIAHEIDLMVSNYPPSLGDAGGVHSRRIARVPVGVCGPPATRKLRNGFPAALEGRRFVLPTRHSKLRHDLEHYFKLNGIRVETVAEVQDTATQKLMATHGIGLIAAPLVAVEDLIQQKRLIELGQLPGVFEEYYLVSASRRIENPVSQELMRTFKFERSRPENGRAGRI